MRPRKTMAMEEFAQTLKKMLTESMKDITDIRVETITKNDEVIKTTLKIHKTNQTIVSSIDLENCLELYNAGLDLQRLKEAIINFYQKGCRNGYVDFSFLFHWEEVREKIVFQIINRENNQDLLKQVPHLEFLNLAVVFAVVLDEDESSMLVYHNYFKKWGVDMDTLEAVARKNTKKIYQLELISLKELAKKMIRDNDDYRASMLTTKSGYFGAVYLFYPEVLEQIAEDLQTDFYIVPSSIHTLLICPGNYERRVPNWRELLQENNEKMLIKDDVLSSCIYLYRRSEKCLCVVE